MALCIETMGRLMSGDNAPKQCLLAEISWLRGVRNRKLLICRTRNKKVSTTFLISCLVGLRGLAPEIGGCAAVVEAADPSPASPRPDDVLLRVVCSGASPIGARRPVAHVRRASECRKEFPTRLGASAPARVLPTACARSGSGSRPENRPECAPQCATRRGGGSGAIAGRS